MQTCDKLKNDAWVDKYVVCTLQPSDAVEARVWQLHDRGHSRTALWWDIVRVQYCRRQHGQTEEGGFFCTQQGWDSVHYHIIPQVAWSRQHGIHIPTTTPNHLHSPTCVLLGIQFSISVRCMTGIVTENTNAESNACGKLVWFQKNEVVEESWKCAQRALFIWFVL